MRRVIRLLNAYIGRSFLRWMAGRAFMVTLVIEQAVIPLLGFAIWSAALPDEAGISTYYFALLIVQLMTVSYEQHTFSNGIYAGTFGQELVKPQPPVLLPLGENLAIRIWHVLIGIPLLAGFWLVTDVAIDQPRLLLAIPAMLLAAAIRFLFTWTLALSAFWTQQAHGTVGFGETLIFLLGGSAVPIALFPEPFQDLAAILPFRAMLGFPAEIVAGELTATGLAVGYGWQLVWLATGFLLATAVWRRGIRRFTAVGG